VAQTKTEIQTLLAEAHAAPLHRFGQNFMIDCNLVRIVAESAEITADDLVLEVGPGTGTLTEELLAAKPAKVVAVEIDRNLALLLSRRFADDSRFQLIEGDALSGKHELNPDLLTVIADRKGLPIKLVANLPYNIASPLVIELLLAGVTRLIFTVQKEVAERLQASADDDAYGPLSVMAQLLSAVKILRTLPPQAFWPMPKIDSALVCMDRKDQLKDRAEKFGTFLRTLFSARRKTIRKSMTMAGFPAEEILSRLNFDGQQRPENFSPAQWLAMFEMTSDLSPPSASS
jgi:16S rRNA (adenine1518-N6/adenine1519-N6)-dimethyltransferase